MDVKETLKERQGTHGAFSENAVASQALKTTITNQKSTHVYLDAVQQEVLDVICAKIARIITGDPDHTDSWHDIAGYAMLAEQDITDKYKDTGKEPWVGHVDEQ
jgi:hypothetical protein